MAAIPSRLVRDDGAYEMVAMIDGVDANKRFVSSVRVVENQRKELGSGDGESDQEGRAALIKKNEEYLLRTYGFKPGGNHLLVPVRSRLYRKPSGEKKERILVGTLESVEAYDKLQELRNRYQELSGRSSASAAEEAQVVANSLEGLFGFQVGEKHDLVVEKSLLFQKASSS